MRRTLRRSLTTTTAAVALLLTLTACGGDEEKTGDAASGSSPSATQSSPAAGHAAGEQVEPASFADDMKAGLDASTTAKMTMTMESAGTSIDAEGQVDYTTKPVSMAMTMTSAMMGNQPIDMRLVEGVIYMNMGKMSQGKFISFDLGDSSNLPPGMSGLADQMDPLASFEQFEPALKTVTFVGDEDVDGEQLAHYEVVLDPEKMTTLQGVPASAGMPDEVTSNLWFDDQFRVRQMRMQMDLAQPVSTEVKLFDWDQPVQIEAPPADQVVDPSTAQG